MGRLDHREKLRSPELPGTAGAQEGGGGSRLTREKVSRIAMERRGMLETLRGEITPALRDALAEKLRYEERLLAEALERDERAVDSRRRRQMDLPAEHFLKKTLDPHLI